jgi:hypothetical protein
VRRAAALGALGALGALAALSLAACSSTSGAEAAPTGSLVLGVEAELEALGAVRLELVPRERGVEGAPLELGAPPVEHRFDGKPERTPVGGLVRALGPSGEVLVARELDARVRGGEALFARVTLGRECLPGAEIAPGWLAPSCPEGLTCELGRCDEPFLDGSRLSPYAPGWATPTPAPCRPEPEAPASLSLGTGQSSLEDAPDGAVVPFHYGLQGGHHVYVSLAFSGVGGEAARVVVTTRVGEQAFTTDTIVKAPACELVGHRGLLPLVPSSELDGAEARLEVSVSDGHGARAFAARRWTLAYAGEIDGRPMP